MEFSQQRDGIHFLSGHGESFVPPMPRVEAIRQLSLMQRAFLCDEGGCATQLEGWWQSLSRREEWSGAVADFLGLPAAEEDEKTFVQPVWHQRIPGYMPVIGTQERFSSLAPVFTDPWEAQLWVAQNSMPGRDEFTAAFGFLQAGGRRRETGVSLPDDDSFHLTRMLAAYGRSMKSQYAPTEADPVKLDCVELAAGKNKLTISLISPGGSKNFLGEHFHEDSARGIALLVNQWLKPWLDKPRGEAIFETIRFAAREMVGKMVEGNASLRGLRPLGQDPLPLPEMDTLKVASRIAGLEIQRPAESVQM